MWFNHDSQVHTTLLKYMYRKVNELSVGKS